MSTSLVIVAIPAENDRVWKISSEKVPHLTLLFLGDEEGADTQQIVQFVEHAVTLSEHGPFYLDVDHRGELGEDQADVLFFNKRSWNLKWIKQFRGQLLQNQSVRTAYDSAQQFTAPQDWVPHLTLGFPETPAKEPPPENDYPLYSVEFDRIAVWVGDSEGPEFRLEWPDRPEELDGPLAVAWADEQKRALTHRIMMPDVEEETSPEALGEKFILEHYGIKGMRWGFRRAAPTAVAPTATSRVPHGNRRKTKVETEGGQNHPAHEDAIRVAEAKVKLKKSGTAALSNKELLDVANRVQLEERVKLLTSSKGKKFVKGELESEGKNLAKAGAKKAAKKGATKVATTAFLA